MAEQLLLAAVAADRVDQTWQLLHEGGNPNAFTSMYPDGLRGRTPLHVTFPLVIFCLTVQYAADRGYLAIVDILLSFEADPNVKEPPDCGGSTPLHLSTRNGHIKAVESLLSHGANPNLIDTQVYPNAVTGF